MSTSKKIIFFGLALAFIFAGAYSIGRSESAQAAAGSLKGWGWSSNIGWINFDGVVKNDDGTLSGYAWANPQDDTAVPPTKNIGWFQFGGLSGVTNASIDAAGKMHGFARALSADWNGWDGWVSFDGTATDGSPYGVTLGSTPGTFCPSATSCPGYDFAWGSDVVGWIDMSGVYLITDFDFVLDPPTLPLGATAIQIQLGTPNVSTHVASRLLLGSPAGSGFFGFSLSTDSTSDPIPGVTGALVTAGSYLPTSGAGTNVDFILNGLGGLAKGSYVIHVSQSVSLSDYVSGLIRSTTIDLDVVDTIPPLGTPDTPTPSVATGACGGAIIISGYQVSGAGNLYRIWREDTNPNRLTQIYDGEDTIRTDTGLTSGTSYSYRVQAYNGLNNSALSNPVPPAFASDVCPVNPLLTNCTGTIPFGSGTVKGPDQYTPPPPTPPSTDWDHGYIIYPSSATSLPSVGACQWTCNLGYSKVEGETGANKNSCRPIPGYGQQ
ncbi:MAG: fibronectin type III domain-containing protein [Candidatus Taylorbacteria bacterium]